MDTGGWSVGDGGRHFRGMWWWLDAGAVGGAIRSAADRRSFRGGAVSCSVGRRNLVARGLCSPVGRTSDVKPAGERTGAFSRARFDVDHIRG